MSLGKPVTRKTDDMSTWPEPQWYGRMITDSCSGLWWNGQVEVFLDDDSVGDLVSVEVQVDLLGRLMDASWWCHWSVEVDPHLEDGPPWDGFASFWQKFASETWLEAMKPLVEERFKIAVRESRSGALIMYGSRKDAKAAADKLGVVLHAYNQAPADQVAAVRLAQGWAGTPEEFVETLPKILGWSDGAR